MPLYRAKSMGTLPDGRRVREGVEFEFEGRQGAWMELVEAEAEPVPSLPSPVEVKAESAVEIPAAESRRKAKRKETE